MTVEPRNERAGCAIVHVAIGLVKMAPNKSFHDLLANILNKWIHILKNTIVTNVADSPDHIITTEVTLPRTVPEAVSAVQYKTLLDVDTLLTCH